MEELDNFFLSTNKELLSTVNRLDKLIGNKHWLTVGTYKESLLKNQLRKVIPNRYSINSGFIVAANLENKIINSTQLDILIWDSYYYSPLYRDDDFVIIPPESCKIVIEVKGMLTKKELRNTIHNFDRLIHFREVQNLQQFNIAKFIFAYELKDFTYPIGFFNSLSNIYNNCEYLSLEDRLDLIEKGYPSMFSPWPLYILNGIFILTTGFINSFIRLMSDDKHRLVFQSFSIDDSNTSNVYSLFETQILSLLGSFSGGRQGLWYSDQPGLFSLRKQIKIKQSSPKSIMFLPYLDPKYYPNDIDDSTIYCK